MTAVPVQAFLRCPTGSPNASSTRGGSSLGAVAACAADTVISFTAVPPSIWGSPRTLPTGADAAGGTAVKFYELRDNLGHDPQAMKAIRQLERALAAYLDADLFEDLVFDLVRIGHSQAKRIRSPDFGADIVAQSTTGPLVWQVKFYTGKIHWVHCVRSLEGALAHYDPAAVCFVFPRDLTGREAGTFTRRLVTPFAPRHVDRWSAADLRDRLEVAPYVAARYFNDADVSFSAQASSLLRVYPVGAMRDANPEDLGVTRSNLAVALSGSETPPYCPRDIDPTVRDF